MITIFRRIRSQMLSENKIAKYLLYAIGEILLVVIGILIALQINNSNDLRKERQRELQYLQNIKSDLIINIAEMESYIATRNNQIEAANRILEHFEGKPIKDLSAFNADGFSIYSWQKFYQSNNTFQELVNSGNLALITNELIKKSLLDLESLYKKMKAEEAHFRFDTETNLYEPIYSSLDLNPMIQNVEYYLSKGQVGRNTPLPDNYFEGFLKNKQIKNGFVLTVLELNTLNGQMKQMIELSEKLIGSINSELAT